MEADRVGGDQKNCENANYISGKRYNSGLNGGLKYCFGDDDLNSIAERTGRKIRVQNLGFSWEARLIYAIYGYSYLKVA